MGFRVRMKPRRKPRLHPQGDFGIGDGGIIHPARPPYSDVTGWGGVDNSRIWLLATAARPYLSASQGRVRPNPYTRLMGRPTLTRCEPWAVASRNMPTVTTCVKGNITMVKQAIRYKKGNYILDFANPPKRYRGQ